MTTEEIKKDLIKKIEELYEKSYYQAGEIYMVLSDLKKHIQDL